MNRLGKPFRDGISKSRILSLDLLNIQEEEEETTVHLNSCTRRGRAKRRRICRNVFSFRLFNLFNTRDRTSSSFPSACVWLTIYFERGNSSCFLYFRPRPLYVTLFSLNFLRPKGERRRFLPGKRAGGSAAFA